ncbi:hypothetical protein DSM107007_02330 [Nostoc sp. PCC 7120 = FACHB-418]|nr:hypothetical protein DSM107007_02330 [Nostoc sp. PCC 7120 = FACHB-418]
MLLRHHGNQYKSTQNVKISRYVGFGILNFVGVVLPWAISHFKLSAGIEYDLAQVFTA